MTTSPETCINGHPKDANWKILPSGVGRCKMCAAVQKRRQAEIAAPKPTDEPIEPDATYVHPARVPERSRIATGYWHRLVRRVELLEPGEALRVSLTEAALSDSASSALRCSAEERDIEIEIRYAGHCLYVIRR